MFGTLMVYIRTRTKEFAIFNLVCLCVVGYSVCPLIHNFFLLPTRPWYALETMIYYLILSCMIRLEDCIMGKNGEISDSSDQSLDRDRFLSGELCGHTSLGRDSL